MLAELEKEQEKRKAFKGELIKEEVDEHDIALVLSCWTGIPVEKLTTSELDKYVSMAEKLKRKVIGQDEAIEEVSNAIIMHRAGIADPEKPIGSFLFLGPTGVGKTEVAKSLADFLFDDSKKLIRIDMSEYMEKHAVARLIGAPPGYIGYEEGGQLTEQVRRNPYSVILCDEIEKAHPDVFNLFLQILDEGHLTDSQGRIVSFKNCIIIMTSNIGSEILLQAQSIDDKVKGEIFVLMQKIFRPEFLNRIDAIVFFKVLTPEDIVKIARLQLDDLKDKMEQKNITLSFNEDVVKAIAQKGYEKEFGARPLKRAIVQFLSIPIAHFILKNPDSKKIHISFDKNNTFIIAAE